MKFGVREICDVVLRAKATQQIGNKVFYENEPVIYFDTLKTSSMEGASTTVYAQGGRGNSRLVAWEGERTVTFTMEDALISPIGFMILSGAGLVEANSSDTTAGKINKYFWAETPTSIDGSTVTVSIDVNGSIDTGAKFTAIQAGGKEYLFNAEIEAAEEFSLGKTNFKNQADFTSFCNALKENKICVVKCLTTGTVNTNSIKVHCTEQITAANADDIYISNLPYCPSEEENFIYVMLLDKDGEVCSEPFIYTASADAVDDKGYKIVKKDGIAHDGWDPSNKVNGRYGLLVDYYTEKTSGAQQIDITPDSFGGNFYLEASTLFRTPKGVDMPAEFIIPNCKIQSNFTFTMASSGDPSSFTFTMDAFPDYTRFDRTKKVLAAIQIIEEEKDEAHGWGTVRTSTSAASGR